MSNVIIDCLRPSSEPLLRTNSGSGCYAPSGEPLLRTHSSC